MAGVVAFALAAGGIAAGLLIPAVGAIPHNIIGAGHLMIEVNHGLGSDLSIENLAPGESRTADQLVTADMAGVGATDLAMTLSGAAPGPFTDNAWMTVSVSAPVSESDAHWANGRCAPTGGFAEAATYPVLAALHDPQTLPLGSLTDSHDAVCVRFEIGLAASADNSVQAATGGFAMDYTLSQTLASP
jgi:hypothetical protein